MKTFINLIITFSLFIYLFSQNVYSAEKIKIGLIVPLSGEYKEIGNSIVKSARLAINKIDDSRIEIIPRDTKSNPETTLKISKELYEQGIKIIIGPVFNKNLIYLDELNEVTFLSLSNTNINNPKNVISGGINAISQINAIKEFQKFAKLERSILLIPNSEFKNEIEDKLSTLSSTIKRSEELTSEFHKKTDRIYSELDSIKNATNKSSSTTSKEVIALLKLSEYQSSIRIQSESKYGTIKEIQNMAYQTTQIVNLFDKLSIESDEKIPLPDEVRGWAISKILDCSDAHAPILLP